MKLRLAFLFALAFASTAQALLWIVPSRFAAAVGGSYDSEAQAYFDAIVSNGGTISTASKGYVNTFILAAKSHGYWSKIKHINLFAGDQLSAALVAIKPGVGTSVDTNHNFVGGDYTESGGLVGNGSTKYLDTGMLASSLSANDTHIAQYNKTNETSSTSAIGAAYLADSVFSCHFPYSGTLYSDQYNSGGSAGRVSTGCVSAGLHIGTRTSSSAHVIYVAGSSVASSSTSGGTLSTIAYNCFVFCRNDAGTPNYFFNAAMIGYSFGSGLSSTDASNFSTDWAALQGALGR